MANNGLNQDTFNLLKFILFFTLTLYIVLKFDE